MSFDDIFDGFVGFLLGCAVATVSANVFFQTVLMPELEQAVSVRLEACEGEARDAAGGTGGDRAPPDGNHGDNLGEVQR